MPEQKRKEVESGPASEEITDLEEVLELEEVLPQGEEWEQQWEQRWGLGRQQG